MSHCRGCSEFVIHSGRRVLIDPSRSGWLSYIGTAMDCYVYGIVL